MNNNFVEKFSHVRLNQNHWKIVAYTTIMNQLPTSISFTYYEEIIKSKPILQNMMYFKITNFQLLFNVIWKKKTI
jgi:hypothetical protein